MLHGTVSPTTLEVSGGVGGGGVARVSINVLQSERLFWRTLAEAFSIRVNCCPLVGGCRDRKSLESIPGFRV